MALDGSLKDQASLLKNLKKKKSLFSEFGFFSFYQFVFHQKDSAQTLLSGGCLPYYGNIYIIEVYVKV